MLPLNADLSDDIVNRELPAHEEVGPCPIRSGNYNLRRQLTGVRQSGCLPSSAPYATKFNRDLHIAEVHVFIGERAHQSLISRFFD